MPSEDQNKSFVKELEYFRDKALTLSDEKYDEVLTYGFSISIHEDRLGKKIITTPDNDMLSSFLMNLRFFTIYDNNPKKNPYSFKNICNNLIQNGYKVDEVKKWLDAFERSLESTPIKINLSGKEFTRNEIFETILNEEYFHQEHGRAGVEFYKSHFLSEPLVRMNFFNLLSELKLLITNFNKLIIERFLEENGVI